MANGWTPSTGGRSGAADGKAVPPSAPTRRRRKAALPSETPNLDAAVAASPPRVGTGMRPPGGKNPSQPHTRGQDDRENVKVRLGKRWSEIYTAVKRGDYTWQQFCDGLDEEELARGQLRSHDGGFVGRPPAFVPREFHLACQREMRRRFELVFSKDVIAIAEQYVELAKNSDIPADKRAKMMQYAMERIFGPIPKEVRVSSEQPWEQMMVNVVTEEGEGMPEHLRRRYETYAERQGDGVPGGED